MTLLADGHGSAERWSCGRTVERHGDCVVVGLRKFVLCVLKMEET